MYSHHENKTAEFSWFLVLQPELSAVECLARGPWHDAEAGVKVLRRRTVKDLPCYYNLRLLGHNSLKKRMQSVNHNLHTPH
jgi:hypothetical protein